MANIGHDQNYCHRYYNSPVSIFHQRLHSPAYGGPALADYFFNNYRSRYFKTLQTNDR